MCNTYLEELISLLHSKDQNFSKFWQSQSDDDKNKYQAAWKLLNELTKLNFDDIQQSNKKVYLQTRIWLSLVQEIGFSYKRIPEHWAVTASKPQKLQDMYNYNLDQLSIIINKIDTKNQPILYGGVKEYSSIREKIELHGNENNAVRRNVQDLWDLVRFRIVVNDLQDLAAVGIGMWRESFSEIVRCRNYYFYPRGDNFDDPYRAIHFEILDDRQGMFELQIMTKHREAVSLLDHGPKFKRSISVNDERMDEWITKLSYAANIAEFNEGAPLWS